MTPRAGAVRLAAAVAAGAALRAAVRRRRRLDLRGRPAVVTGGSRGLGLAIARELVREGCPVAICARDEAELMRAEADLLARGGDVLAVPADVSRPEDAGRLIAEATLRFGRVDLLVNNAGVILGGPAASLALEDFDHAMAVNFRGALHPTLAVLPQMRARREGRIAFVTSFGGKVSVPHLVPYNCSKFAAVALAQGLRAELARDGVLVSNVAPGLLRTGSFLNARFKGRREAEFVWFSVLDNLPGISMDARRAARRVVAALRDGVSDTVLGLPASVLARVHGAAPGTVTQAMAVVNRLLPDAPPAPNPAELGRSIHARVRNAALDAVLKPGLEAARRLHQHPGPFGGNGGLREASGGAGSISNGGRAAG